MSYKETTVIRVDYRPHWFKNMGRPKDAWVVEWTDVTNIPSRDHIHPPTTEGLLDAVNDAFLSAINRQREGLKTYLVLNAPDKIHTLCLLPPQEILDGPTLPT
jgi:hypothetical protein